MRTPSLAVSAQRIFQYFSQFHLILLRTSVVSQKAPELVARYLAAHDDLGATIEARTEAENKLVEAAAYRSRAHQQMGRGLRDFAYAVLGRVQEDRSAPLYRAYFPEGYGRFSRIGIARQIAAAELMLAQLAQVPDEELAPDGQVLSSVLEEVKAREAEYQAALEAERAARQAVEVAKRPWRNAYRASYHALSIFHADDPREAEAYFRRFDARSRVVEEGEEDVLEGESGLGDGVDGDGDAPVDGGLGGEGLTAVGVSGNGNENGTRAGTGNSNRDSSGSDIGNQGPDSADEEELVTGSSQGV